MSNRIYQVSENAIETVLTKPGLQNETVQTVLKHLFPEYFREDEVFCKIGQILKRSNYPNNAYAVMNLQAFDLGFNVAIVSISNCKVWRQEISVNNLKARDKKSITYGEFRRLCGGQSVDNFSIANI